MNKLLAITIFLLFNFFNLYSQSAGSPSSIPNVIPPSPNAAAIEKFNIIPVNYSTGIPNISYPLWSWKKNQLEFNLSLIYHAGGYKIDDIASNVGMGWTINGLGRVSRTVRGLPDDNFKGFINTPELPQVETYMNYNETYNFTSPFIMERDNYPNNMGITDLNSDFSQIVAEINKNELDGEQDVFSFSANNISGSFILSKNSEIVPLEQTNCKIEFTNGPNYSNTDVKGPIISFKITDDKGIEYFFETLERQWAESVPASFPPTNNGGDYISSWLISRIIDPISQEIVSFTYTVPDIFPIYETGRSESINYRIPHTVANVSSSTSMSYQKITLTEPILQEINFSEGSKVLFEYSFNREDLINSKGLTSIQIKNMRNELVKYFKLNYSYFISGNNFFNPNTDISLNDFNKRLKLINVEETSTDNLEIKRTSFEYNNLALNPRASYNQDYWGFNVNPQRNNPGLVPILPLEQQEINMLNRTTYFVGHANRNPDEEFGKAGVLEKITYPTGGSTVFEYECNKAFSAFNYNIKSIAGNNLIWEKAQFGLSRNLKFVDRNMPNIIIKFKADEIDPRPILEPGQVQSCLENQQDNNEVKFIVSSVLNNYSQEITEIYSNLLGGFERVLQLPLANDYTIKFIYNDNATCSYVFPFNVTVSTEHFIEPIDKLVGGLRIKSIKNFNGEEQISTKNYYYNNSSSKSSATLHAIPNYKYSRLGIDESFLGNWCGVNPYILWTYNFTFTSTPGNTLHFFNGGPLIYKIVKEEFSDGSYILRKYDDLSFSPTGGPTDRVPFVPLQYFSNLSGLIAEESIKNSNGTTQSEKKYTYNKSLTNFLNQDKHRNLKTYISAKSVGIVSNACNYDAIYYLCYQYFMKSSTVSLQKLEEKIYDGNNALVKVTENEYNAKNYLATETTTNSKNEELKTTYSYPFQNSNNSAVSNLMVQKNMNSTVINTKVTKKINNVSVPISDKYTEYGIYNTNLPLPADVKIGVLNNLPTSEITFEKYDNKGNILQYTAKDGIIHSFIWGYNQQYPVAHLVGVENVTATALIDQALLNNPSSSEQQIKNNLNNLFIGLPNTVQITTYTYIPLVGIKSVKDSNGKEMNYEYDNFYRLKLVRDQDGIILSAQQYHYAQ